jgi:hypothetical protein
MTGDTCVCVCVRVWFLPKVISDFLRVLHSYHTDRPFYGSTEHGMCHGISRRMNAFRTMKPQ